MAKRLPKWGKVYEKACKNHCSRRFCKFIRPGKAGNDDTNRKKPLNVYNNAKNIKKEEINIKLAPKSH